MERRRFLGALTAASLGVALDGFLVKLARAQNTAQAAANSQASKTSGFPPNSTIILVHGAWADGSCWRNVILPLERRGLHVICVPIPLTSLTNDTAALSWTLERTSGPVVLVGHAYSGAVIAAVREDRVKSLVYIAALAPDEGETVASSQRKNTGLSLLFGGIGDDVWCENAPGESLRPSRFLVRFPVQHLPG